MIQPISVTSDSPCVTFAVTFTSCQKKTLWTGTVDVPADDL